MLQLNIIFFNLFLILNVIFNMTVDLLIHSDEVVFFVFQLIIYYIFLFKRYDLKETSKLTLQDVQLICAMGPPGGGRNDVTLRFMRHFNIIGMNSFSEETMIKIFSILISTYLRVSRECFFHFCYQFYYLISTDFF